MSQRIFSSFSLGSTEKKPVFLLHGFPDDALSCWSQLLPLLQQQQMQGEDDECGEERHLVSLQLPGFGRDPAPRWGVSFDILVEGLKETIDQWGEEPVDIIAHDWGATLALLFENKYPKRVKRIVLIDVGIVKASCSWSTLLIIFYQWTFSFAYVLSQIFGRAAGKSVLAIFYLVTSFLPFLRVSPDDKNLHRNKDEVNVEMCYIYFQFWKEFFKNFRLIKPNFPVCKMLYLFGRKKNAMFHSQGFLDRINQTKGCHYVGYNCGHYPQHDCVNDVAAEIQHFLT